jgi:hypothetical protein
LGLTRLPSTACSLREEEELKTKLDAVDIALGSTVGALQEGTGNADELDLSQMNEKEKKKVIAQRIAGSEKAKKRLDKKAARAIDNSTAEEASSGNEEIVPAIENPLKRDSTSLKLQQGTVTRLQNVGSANMLVDDLIVNYSLLSIDQHSAKHNAFPKCWDDIIAFLEKVSDVLLFLKITRVFLSCSILDALF